ncbi:MAG: ATP-binding protein [Patescibacteria group bacterium]|jgi:signal transduction histidine kinase
MYLYFAFSALFNAIVSLLLGIFVFLKNKKSKVNSGFAFFCISVAVWSIFYIGWPLSATSSQTLFWFRLLHIGASFTPITYFHFVVNWLNLYKRKRMFVFMGYLLAVLFSVSVFSPYFIVDMVPKFSLRFWAEPGIIYHFYLFYFFGYVVFSSILLYLNYKKTSGIKKHQIKLILAGIALSFIGGSTNYFLWYNINIPPYGNILASSFVAFTAYAIIRYRFMDVRIVIRRFFIYFSSAIFVFAFLYLSLWFFNKHARQDILYIYVLLAAILFTIGFYFFENLLIKIVNKYFFAGLYNYQEAIKKLSKELTYSNNLTGIVNSIVETIKKTIQLDRAGVLLANVSKSPIIFKTAKVIGFNEKDGISLVKDNFLINYLEKTKQPLVADELLFLANTGKIPVKKKKLEGIYESMNRLKISICLPLINKNKLIGVIILGDKLSGGAYTKEDLELLSILANQAGIAINNANLYQQIKDFNKILESKVEAQTKELRKKAKELEGKNINLEKLLEIKDEFLHVVNHQLNTPVSIIKNSVYMVRSGSFPLEKGLDFVDEGVKRIQEVLTGFWKAFSLGAEELKIKKEEVDLEEMIDKLVEDVLMPAVKSKGLKIKVEKNIHLPHIKGDKDQLRQVVSNLLENAVSYTASGSVKFYFENKNKEMLKIFVADTGCGIDEKDKDKLFGRFVRGARAVHVRPSGSGLGLYIAKKIVEAHGGELKLESSKVDKGTTFSFTLPIWK